MPKQRTKKLLKDAEKVAKLGEKLLKSAKWQRAEDKRKFAGMIKKLQKIVADGKRLEKSAAKKAGIRAIYGGGDIAKDIAVASQNIGLSVVHVFDSMKNLTQDMYCESDSIMNIAKEIDTGKSGNCPFTTTKSWTYDDSTGMLK